MPAGEYRNDGAGSQFVHHEARRQINGNPFAREKACTADFRTFPASSESVVQHAGCFAVDEDFVITSVGGVAHQNRVLLQFLGGFRDTASLEVSRRCHQKRKERIGSAGSESRIFRRLKTEPGYVGASREQPFDAAVVEQVDLYAVGGFKAV